MSNLELLRAYCDTIYRAKTPGGNLDLRIAQPSPELDDVLVAFDVADWAFVTASNPRSRVLPADENAARFLDLLVEVEDVGGYLWFDAEAINSDDAWPPEQGLVIAGIAEDDALELARRFDQHAIVCGSVGGPARLRFCRFDEWRETISAGQSDCDAVVLWVCADTHV